MLDLELLERQLDEALANETDESLTAWLFKERFGPLVDFLSKGESFTFEACLIGKLNSNVDTNIYNIEQINFVCENNSIAA